MSRSGRPQRNVQAADTDKAKLIVADRVNSVMVVSEYCVNSRTGAVTAIKSYFERFSQLDVGTKPSKRVGNVQDDVTGADQWLEIFRDKIRCDTDQHQTTAVTSQTWLDIFREKRRADICHVLDELTERQKQKEDRKNNMPRPRRRTEGNKKNTRQQLELRIIRLLRRYDSLAIFLEEMTNMKLRQSERLSTYTGTKSIQK